MLVCLDMVEQDNVRFAQAVHGILPLEPRSWVRGRDGKGGGILPLIGKLQVDGHGVEIDA